MVPATLVTLSFDVSSVTEKLTTRTFKNWLINYLLQPVKWDFGMWPSLLYNLPGFHCHCTSMANPLRSDRSLHLLRGISLLKGLFHANICINRRLYNVLDHQCPWLLMLIINHDLWLVALIHDMARKAELAYCHCHLNIWSYIWMFLSVIERRTTIH